MSRAEAHDLWRRFVNPDLVDLLEAFGFGRQYVRARGTKLYDETGREYTDCLAGFGVHNVRHDHPRPSRPLGWHDMGGGSNTAERRSSTVPALMRWFLPAGGRHR